MTLQAIKRIMVVGLNADDTDPIVSNIITLSQRAQTALTNNATFLAIGSPTQAQAVAQVQALTRQVDGIIRLLQEQLDSVANT